MKKEDEDKLFGVIEFEGGWSEETETEEEKESDNVSGFAWENKPSKPYK